MKKFNDKNLILFFKAKVFLQYHYTLYCYLFLSYIVPATVDTPSIVGVTTTTISLEWNGVRGEF